MLGLTAPESLAGVIAASGGFPLGHPPSRDTPFAFFATVGNADFNYYELRDLDERMAALGLPHRVEVFAGAHERPPAEVLSRAIGWMEVAALRRGRRPPSAELVEGVWGEELARAEGLARAGDAPAALAAYRGLAADFAGLRPAADLEAVARRAAALAAAPAVERAAAAERARDARDRAYLESVPRLLQTAGAEEAPERVARTLADLRAAG